MKITDDNIIIIQLRARDVYERALVAGTTSPRDSVYQDRMEWAREALVELLNVIEVRDFVPLIDGMSDDDFSRDRSGENPNVGKIVEDKE